MTCPTCAELQRRLLSLEAENRSLRDGWRAAERAARRAEYLLAVERALASGQPAPTPPDDE